MAGVEKRVASKPSVSLYIADVITNKDESGIEAVVIPANLAGKLETMPDLMKEREVFTRSYYGEDAVEKLAGQADFGSSDFAVDWDNSSFQNDLLDLAGQKDQSFVFVVQEDPSDASNTNMTYVVRDGFLSKQDIMFSGDTTMLSFTATWVSDSTRVDNA